MHTIIGKFLTIYGGEQMQQMDMFSNSSEDYLYGELQKTKHTMSKSFRALFALVTEMQTQIMQMQQVPKEEKKERKNG